MPEPAALAVAETVLPTDSATGRPIWKGLPVPWVTRWSGEVMSSRPGEIVTARYDGLLHLAYATPDPNAHALGVRAGFEAQRDELGLLWYRDLPDRQGVGEPRFADLHADRQRRCVVDRLCQVCGRAFDDAPVTFLEPEALLGPGGAFWTWNAPVCAACVPVSMRLCPHQRTEPRQLITAHAFRPAMAIVDLYSDTEREARQLRMPLHDNRIRRSITKQLIVRITDYDAEPITE